VKRRGQHIFHLRLLYHPVRFFTNPGIVGYSLLFIEGAYSSIIQATSSSSVVPSTSDHVSPSFYSPSSSKHLDKIVAPTVIIPLVVIVVAAIWLIRRKTVPHQDVQVVATGNLGSTSRGFFSNAQHIVAPHSIFTYIEGNQRNMPHQPDSSSAQ
jgi:hypothetical protein